MIVRAIRTKIFRPRQSLEPFLISELPRLRDGSIVVVTSKIVALAEGRVVSATTSRAFDRLVKSESDWTVKTKHTWLTVKDNIVMASAGVDQSNGNGQLILLPTDSYRWAKQLRRFLMRRYRLRRLGVLITDSHLTPLREGIVGLALGYAGFRGLRDYRGQPDIFGRRLRMTRTNVADSLATAAVLTMGEGSERRPLAVIEDAPVIFSKSVNRRELLIDPTEDIYRPLFLRSAGQSLEFRAKLKRDRKSRA